MASGSKISRYSFSTVAAKQKIEKILAATSEKALSRNQIKELIHVTHSYCNVYIRFLMNTKQIYISTWKLETQGERTMQWPYYKAGNQKSKAKPKALSISEKCKRYRKKLSKDADRVENLNMRRRAKRIKAKPDWTTSWIKSSLSGQNQTT
jgi:hypothetical protein